VPVSQRCERVPDEPGAEMQHDTSPFTLVIGSERLRLQASLLYLRYAQRRYLQFDPVFDRFHMKCFLHLALIHRLTESSYVFNMKECVTLRPRWRANSELACSSGSLTHSAAVGGPGGLGGDSRSGHPAKWHTARGVLSVSGPKFMNWHLDRGGGGAIDLVMHVRQVGFGQALEWLEQRFGSGTSLPSQAALQTSSLALPPPEAGNWPRVERYLIEGRKLPATATTGHAIVLCESAIDALSCRALHPDFGCLSTSGARPDPGWLPALITLGLPIYCGFDADPPVMPWPSGCTISIPLSFVCARQPKTGTTSFVNSLAKVPVTLLAPYAPRNIPPRN